MTGRPPRRSFRAGGSFWTRGACLLLLTVALPGTPEDAGSQEFQVDRQGPRTVRFISQTTLEEFEGVGESIDGYVYLPGGVRVGDGFSDSQLYLEVELSGLDTGISLRNRHMRDNYLETDRFPYATFSGRVERIERDATGPYRVSALGTFQVHGVERERTLTCQASSTGARYAVTCRFPVSLRDHDIEIPRVMFLKLAEEVEVVLEFTLVEASSN